MPDDNTEPNAFDRIVPVARAQPAAYVEKTATTAARQISAAAIAAGVGIVLVIAAVLFGALYRAGKTPRHPDTEPRAQVALPAQPPAPADASASPAPWNDESLLQARQAAQNAAADFDARLVALRGQAVDRWASSELAAAQMLHGQARKAFDGRDFQAAASTDQRSLAQLEALAQRVPVEIDKALASGTAALGSNDGAAATAAFELALAIAPDNAAARRGLQRVQSLPQVRVLLDQARAAQSAGQMPAAAEAYRAVLKLDEQSAAAQSGLRQVQAVLSEQAYQRAMTQALTALDRDDFAAAQTAYGQALKLRPEADAAVEGLALAKLGRQSQQITQQLAQAQAQERREDWAAAVQSYSAALATDPSLVAARDGASRSQARAALAARIQGHVQGPERLQSANIYADAEAALTQARGIALPGPMLTQQAAALEQALRSSATPVAVTLQSDAKTEVAVYKIGELGRFQSRQLSLRPGRYVAVGTRAGYRDVRQEFDVTAGASAATIVVRCEERI